MSKTYYSVLTTYGSQLFASAMANRQAVNIRQMAVGDGNGRAVTPDSARTTLVREVHRANISAVSPDPRNNKQVIFELTIPENVGGFWIREIGIYDAQNRLVAYANCPETFKPRLEEGSGKIQVIRMVLLVSSSNAVTLTVDDSVIWATRGQLTPKTITANSQNSVDSTGHTHAIDSASTTQKGIVQLNNTLTSTSQEQALTAAQGKVLNDKITQNEQKTLELTNQKVNKTDVSDSVSSNSQTTVGSSRAVKTAYDKGVEAKNTADNAQNSANNANNNANGRVSKSGDTMTGDLVVPYLKTTGQYLSVTAKNNQFAGLDVIRQGNIGNWLSRIEALPDKRWKFWTEGGYDVFVPNRNGTLALDEDVRNKVAKTGDEINWLRVINDNSVLHLKSRNSAGAYIDFSVWNSSYAHSSIECIDVGNWATELRFHTTPQGDDYNSDRRHHVATINPNGAIWAKEYGVQPKHR
ncbi:phage tail protein, partial [Ursidibacter arcticus]|uniref:phage tail protein n=1 Tax=Ursidibacter arcticus TaxID=1524965 RepID=UPI001967A92B